MHREVFALFDDVKDADAALAELSETVEDCEERCNIVMHEKALRASDLEVAETSAGAGLRLGMLLGVASGALVGAIMSGPLGLIGGGPAFAALAGGVHGGLLGGLLGFLGGTASPDRKLAKLAKGLEEGKVLVAIDVRGMVCADQVQEVLARHGAAIDHPSMLAI